MAQIRVPFSNKNHWFKKIFIEKVTIGSRTVCVLKHIHNTFYIIFQLIYIIKCISILSFNNHWNLWTWNLVKNLIFLKLEIMCKLKSENLMFETYFSVNLPIILQWHLSDDWYWSAVEIRTSLSGIFESPCFQAASNVLKEKWSILAVTCSQLPWLLSAYFHEN